MAKFKRGLGFIPTPIYGPVRKPVVRKVPTKTPVRITVTTVPRGGVIRATGNQYWKNRFRTKK
jgi:hypothetical protein